MRRRDPLFELTPREKEIFFLITKQGLLYVDIATMLGISYKTVKHHACQILVKLEITSRFELAVWAWRNGIVR
ncbi:response regulator transcription factor [Aminobacterium colombiense]|uniref:response regulator transcription factor n=1 Tax=Aminobacterium colombiense TaxID=81468 RepID=UPI0002D7A5AC|nr:helix-turn-helix transcriptional regulator [Aminobacterium colombiense]